MPCRITDEQLAVIKHPLGRHARVLAVAGSGKTFTLVRRLSRLVTHLAVDPASIRVLMFNRLARDQFDERLEREGLSGRVRVNTFHSLAWQLLPKAIERGYLPESLRLVAERSDSLQKRWVRTAIRELRRLREIDDREYDVEACLGAIRMWKNDLVPPDRAGHRTIPAFERIYARYEIERAAAGAVTFDDAIPETIAVCRAHPEIVAEWFGGIAHLLVDEYQDINFAQQILLEMLAGDHADVMAVGDDDQTIYEWRGARPGFILRDMPRRFNRKKTLDYTLSSTFRFGPLPAQLARNVIELNQNRASKTLEASEFASFDVELHVAPHDTPLGSADRLVDVIRRLLVEHRSPPSEIAVLSRIFAQTNALQAACLNAGIPFRVSGQKPFFRRSECTLLLEYLRTGLDWREPLTPERADRVRGILNRPSRRLPAADFDRACDRILAGGGRVGGVFDRLAGEMPIHWSLEQQGRAEALRELLEEAWRCSEREACNAGDVLGRIAEQAGIERHVAMGQAGAEDAEDRIGTVRHFIAFARLLKLDPRAFIRHIESLDPSCGQPDDRLILMTSVFRTKGLEFDHVIIPDCHEYAMPCLLETSIPVFDRAMPDEARGESPLIESERRLFYVAITRARKGLYIGCTQAGPGRNPKPVPSRFIAELRLEATRRVIGQILALYRGDETARRRLMAFAEDGSMPRELLDGIIRTYVRRLVEPDFAGRLAGMVRGGARAEKESGIDREAFRVD